MINTFDGWDSELYHHGIKGQKWGVRRYQNADGSLTAAGAKRYGSVTTMNRMRKGDIVEKTYSREQRRFEKKADRANAKRQKTLAKDGGRESSKSQRLARKAKIYTDSAKFRESMLKKYSDMAGSDRDKIKAGLRVANAAWAIGHVVPVVGILGKAAGGTYSTSKLAYAVDKKNGLARYNNTSFLKDKYTKHR